MLRPGTHLLVRDAHRLQVGLDPRTAVVLTETAEVSEAVRLLSERADLSEYADRTLLDLLGSHEHLLDEHQLSRTPADDGLDPALRAALARTTGDDFLDASATRRARAVEIRGFGHPSGESVRGHLGALLVQAGLKVATPRSRSPRVVALLGVGEPSRETADGWVRTATPYLVVRLTEGNALLGPFVVPGETACLRCIDAHRTDTDSSWPLLVEQYARACRHDRADGSTEPVDPLLAALATAWAARDLATFLEGGRPATWSTTVRIDARVGDIETLSWPRHPHCGCCWDTSPDRMEP